MGTASDSVVQVLFERGGLRAIFDHARNAAVATIFVAAGLETAKRLDATGYWGLLNPLFAGYVVAGVGFALIALNFIDGLRRLANLRWPFTLQAALSVGYLLASFRMVQLVIMMRTHTC